MTVQENEQEKPKKEMSVKLQFSHWERFMKKIIKEYITYSRGNLKLLAKYFGVSYQTITFVLEDEKHVDYNRLFALASACMLLSKYSIRTELGKISELIFTEKERKTINEIKKALAKNENKSK